MKTKEEIAAEAYQVIGALADAANLFDHFEVWRALNYFAEHANSNNIDEEILPWGIYNPEIETVGTTE